MWKGIRSRFHLSYFLWLTFMWILLQGEFSWANVLGGAGLALVILLMLPLPATPTQDLNVHWGNLLRFVLNWFGELAVASVKIGWIAIRPEAPPKNAILRVPMRVSNELVLYFATAAYNLQPGGSVSDIDIANRMWIIHVLDADDDEDIRREIDNVATLERRMIAIFEGGNYA